MDSNKVKNPKQEALPSVNEFNDEDILNDVLISLKHLSTMYGTLKQEASNKTLVSEVEKLSKETGKLARDAFNLMFEKGWYSLELETSSKLSEEYNKFTTKKEEISF